MKKKRQQHCASCSRQEWEAARIVLSLRQLGRADIADKLLLDQTPAEIGKRILALVDKLEKERSDEGHC